MTKRRDLLLGSLALAGVAVGWQAFVRRPRRFDFRAIPGAPGWVMAETGDISAPSSTAFLTLGQGDEPPAPLSPDRLGEVLYRGRSPEHIAVFSDFFCPFCRTLTTRLASRLDIPVIWHELPLLGPPSVIAARAAVAADLQGGYAAFVAALSDSGFRPTPTHMGIVATAAGLDGDRLKRDIEGPEVAGRLHATRRAAEALGIYGTPAIAAGRRVVLGDISLTELNMLRADT